MIASIQRRCPALAYKLRRYFNLGSGPLIVSLYRAGLGQADVVLALLKINSDCARRAVERLVGRPITVCPSCLLIYDYNRSRPKLGSQPVITWVMRSPPLRSSTKIAACYPEFRVGRTREQLVCRGVSRGDIRRAVRRGWIKMSEGVRI